MGVFSSTLVLTSIFGTMVFPISSILSAPISRAMCSSFSSLVIVSSGSFDGMVEVSMMGTTLPSASFHWLPKSDNSMLLDMPMFFIVPAGEAPLP